MRREWIQRRWIAGPVCGDVWLDPNFPDEPSDPGGMPTPARPPDPSGSAGDTATPDGEGDETSSTRELSNEDFTIAALLSRGRPHREIGAVFNRKPKWVQRRLRSNPAIEDVADQLRGQFLTSIAGRVITGLDLPVQILQLKAEDVTHPDQLAATRLLLSDGLKYHSQRIQERGYSQRLEEIEQLLRALREAVLPEETTDEP